MLFPKDLKEVTRLVGEMQKPGADEEALARQLIDADPTFAPAFATLGQLYQEKGNLDEAESWLWKALELWPLSFRLYETLAQMRSERDPEDALARRLQHLATWKLALSGNIPEDAAKRYARLFGDKIGDAWDPETYEVLATVEDVRLKKSPPPPDVEERLRPYILLHDLQTGARRVVSHDTVKDIVEHADECRPLLRGVLREWLRNPSDVSDAMACLSAALLGEIGDRETLEELIVLSQNEIAFLHAHWAIHRIATRLPQDTLEVFRAVIPTASAGERCGLADHLYLMDSAPGMAELLIALTENFPVEADDAAYLLMAVTAALEDLGEEDLAQAVVQRYEPQLNARAARIRRKALDSEEGFVPTLEFEEIDQFDIYEVCLERVYLDEDEEDDDEDIEVPPAPVLAQPKLGRNDPCWCGSGKKYKKCHLEADERGKQEEPEAVSDTPPWIPPGLIPRIAESTFKYHNSSERTKAKQLFFDTTGEVEAEESDVGRFVQWLIFDYRNPRIGKTGLQHFAEVEGRRLKPREREFVESLAGVRLGLYEVQNVEPGRGIDLKNLYADETRFVRDISSSRQLAQWDCLISRVHTYEGNDLFVGDGTSVPRQWLPDLKNWIADQSLAQGISEADFVAANSHRMHRMVLAIREEKISSVKLVTAEGDEMEFSHGHYEVLDQAVLLAALREQSEIVEQTDEDGGGEYHFGWLEGRPKDTGTRSLGHIYIRGGRLRLETTSRPRLKTGRRMLEKIAKRALKHLGDSYESAQQAVNRLKTEPEDVNRKPSAPVPPEVEREVVQRFKTEHYAKWPDEALPALGGKTPRQAMQTPEGRRAVEDLLRTFENLERRESREGGEAFDFSSLRRDLGLDL